MGKILICACISMLSLPLMAAAQDLETQKHWHQGRAEGWFWYKDTFEPEEKEKPEDKPIEQVTVPPPTETQPQKSDGPPALSSAWVRENMQRYLDAAIDNPKDNLAAYLYLQKYAIDKTEKFSSTWQEVMLGNPDLDVISRRPTATFASRELDTIADQNRAQLLNKISSQAGLFFFMGSTRTTTAQYKIIKMLQNSLPIPTLNIAVSEPPPELRDIDFKPDNGHAIQMNIKSTPAIAILRPDGLFDVVAQGPVALNELTDRIIMGSKRLGIISDDEFSSSRPIANAQVTPAEIHAEPSTSQLPIQPAQLVQILRGGSSNE